MKLWFDINTIAIQICHRYISFLQNLNDPCVKVSGPDSFGNKTVLGVEIDCTYSNRKKHKNSNDLTKHVLIGSDKFERFSILNIYHAICLNYDVFVYGNPRWMAESLFERWIV